MVGLHLLFEKCRRCELQCGLSMMGMQTLAFLEQPCLLWLQIELLDSIAVCCRTRLPGFWLSNVHDQIHEAIQLGLLQQAFGDCYAPIGHGGNLHAASTCRFQAFSGAAAEMRAACYAPVARKYKLCCITYLDAISMHLLKGWCHIIKASGIIKA